jgi:DisA bacterial checkpoint controller nucleotide-binding
VEPEYRFFQPGHLEGVVERARELYENDPNYGTIHSNPRVHELYHRSLFDSRRAEAVVEALNRNAPEPVTYFGGRSTRVGDYEVHPIVGIPTDALEAVPQLTVTERDRFPVTRSLLHGCIDVSLSLATKALVQPDAGDALYVLGASADEVARRAAAQLVTSSVMLTGSIHGTDLYSALTAVSTTRYEGASGYGSVIVAAEDDPALAVDVKLRSPVRIGETRGLRKLLEISDRDKLGLLTDGRVIFGLGHVEASYDPAGERIFEFHIVGQGRWLMRHGGDVLFEAEFGQPKLRKERMDKARFADTVERIFAQVNADSENLWKLADAAAEQAHGTMLVISDKAAEEAARLSAQAILIEPESLSPELLRRATGIDGAVLFAPDGTCYALGVILDGSASDQGDRARGARFNSALRYLAQPAVATMIVLVSEDGMIDVLPRLRPRISRRTVERALASYQRLTQGDEVDGEMRADAYDRLKELAFYLTSEQCEMVNRLEAEYQRRRLESGGFAITGRALTPDPDMNESYFID